MMILVNTNILDCTGFDSKGSFSHPSRGYGKNIIIFGVDISSSTHANNKTRSIVVLDRDFIQGRDGTTTYAEKMYSSKFTVANKKFCLSLHYNGDNSYLLVNGKVIIFKAENSELYHINYVSEVFQKIFSIKCS